MGENSDSWMAYTNAEVRAACEKSDVGFQIRRTWSSREKAVSQSSVDDYEWKLIPHADGQQPDLLSWEFDAGRYYVLWLDLSRGKFVLQHDTIHPMAANFPHWSQETFTEIPLIGIGCRDYFAHTTEEGQPREGACFTAPPVNGKLRDCLVYLMSRFTPNYFNVT